MSKKISKEKLSAASLVIRNFRALAKELEQPINHATDEDIYKAWREATRYSDDDMEVLNLLMPNIVESIEEQINIQTQAKESNS